MSTNQQRAEAALRQARADGHLSHAAMVRAVLEALGVDPAGTTEPQGDDAELHRVANVGKELAEELFAARAEVERLRARVAALQAAGDALAAHHDGFIDRGQERRCVEIWQEVRGG